MVDMLKYRCVTSDNRHRVRQEPNLHGDVIGYIEKNQEVEGGEIRKGDVDSWIATCGGWSLMEMKGKQFFESVPSKRSMVVTRRGKQRHQQKQQQKETVLEKTLQKGSVITEKQITDIVSHINSLSSKKIPSIEVLKQIHQFYSSQSLQEVQQSVLLQLFQWLSFSHSESTLVVLSCIGAILGCAPEIIEEHLEVIFDYFCRKPRTPQKEANLLIDHLPAVLIAAVQCECSLGNAPDIEAITSSMTSISPTIIDQLLDACDGGEKLLLKVASEWIAVLESSQFCAANSLLTQLISKLIAHTQNKKYLSVTAEIIGRTAKAVRLMSQCIPTKVDLSLKTRNIPTPMKIPTYSDNCQTIKDFFTKIVKSCSIDQWMKESPSSKAELQELLVITNSAKGSKKNPKSTEAVLSELQNYETTHAAKDTDLNSMEKHALVDDAVSIGIKKSVASKMKKPDLIEKIIKARHAEVKGQLLLYTSCQSLDASCDELYVANAFRCTEDKRQFLSFWEARWSFIAEQVLEDLEEGLEKTITEYAVRVRKAWFRTQLAKTSHLEQFGNAKPNDQLIAYVLSLSDKTLVKYYRNMVLHIAAMFASDKTPPAVKKKICSQLGSLIDVDPSIIEIIWPTVGQYLQKDPSGLSGTDSMMDCLLMVVQKIDRFDSYMQEASSQLPLPSGRIESITKKVLNLVLQVLERSPSASLIKRCLKVLRAASTHHSITSGIHLKILSQLVSLTKKGVFKDNCATDASMLFMSLLSGTSDDSGSSGDPDVIVRTAETLTHVVENEINSGPLLLFETTIAAHKPNPLIESFLLLLQSSSYSDFLSPVATHLLTISSLPTLHLLIRCTSLRDDTSWSKHKQIHPESMMQYVTDLQKTPAPATVENSDRIASRFIHATNILMVLSSNSRKPSKTATKRQSKDADIDIPSSVFSPYLQLLSYSGRNSQLVLVTAIKFLSHVSYNRETGFVRPGPLLSFYDFMNKTYTTMTNAYLKALVLQKGTAAEKQILPHVIRGMFLLCEVVSSMEWIRTAVQKVLRSERGQDALVQPPSSGVTPRNGSILANIYQNVLSVVVNTTKDDKAIALSLKLAGALCRHDGKTYFPVSQRIIEIAMRNEGGNAEPKIAAIELIRDFLVDEEDKIEKAHSRQQSSVESSPGGCNSQDTGIGASILQAYLPGILLCLAESNLHLRSLAMEVVGVSHHQGLSAPAVYIEHIICSSSDSHPSIANTAISLLNSFSSKGWSGTIASKAACGVLRSFQLHLRIALSPPTPIDWPTKQERINQIKGISTASTGIVQSVHLPLYESAASSVQRGKGGSSSLTTARGKAKEAGQATTVLSLVKLLTRSEKRSDWSVEISKICPYAALQFPRYIAEVLCAIPFTKYNQVLNCVEAIENGIAVSVEECTEQLRALLPDTIKPKPSGKRSKSQKNDAVPIITPNSQNQTPRSPFQVVVDVLSVFTLYQLSLFLRSEYDITKRKTRDEGIRSVLQIDSEILKNFFTNTDIVDACCIAKEDGSVEFSSENLSDLAETLASVRISLADPVKRKKPPTKGAKTKRRKRRGSSLSSSSSSSDSDSSSDESSLSSSSEADTESDSTEEPTQRIKRKAAPKRAIKKRK
eukprot:TRINITY_DN12548_c0_g1_i1.p1 TRINITY_DN12548_c0_g1~~TRINITY_DN12548_c0_g1_i1.p1  ORF type:complete len:1609 (+),score=243.86 TRINITY_DN12548_c0_g1_i1:39-4865(+)